MLQSVKPSTLQFYCPTDLQDPTFISYVGSRFPPRRCRPWRAPELGPIKEEVTRVAQIGRTTPWHCSPIELNHVRGVILDVVVPVVVLVHGGLLLLRIERLQSRSMHAASSSSSSSGAWAVRGPLGFHGRRRPWIHPVVGEARGRPLVLPVLMAAGCARRSVLVGKLRLASCGVGRLEPWRTESLLTDSRPK